MAPHSSEDNNGDAKAEAVKIEIHQVEPLEAPVPTITEDADPKSSYPPLRTVFPPFELEERPIDADIPLKAVVVGAGIAGITAGILLPAKVSGIELVIYERESDLVSSISNSTRP